MSTTPREVEALEVLKEFCDDIDATGGVTRRTKAHPFVPVADESWIDLGATYMKACKILNRKPKEY